MIYIHVGFPKTASTTIQRFLAANAGYLEKHNLTYPKISPDRTSSYGVNPDAHNPLAVELRRGAPGPAWNRLKEIIDGGASGRDIVLSGEALSGCKPESLRKALGPAPTTIIFYIREYAKMTVSQYAHRTKIGSNTVDFDRFLEHRLNTRSQALAEHIAAWGPVFGPKNIKVRQLDDRTLTRGDVRLDILDAIGIDTAKMDMSGLEMTEDANTSPGWKTLEILRDLNRALTDKFIAKSDKRALANAKKERRRRNESPLLDFTGFLWRPATKIGRMMGFAERGLYMTEEQYERSNTVFDEQVDALNGLGMDTRLAHAARGSFTPRRFMPSIEHIPPEEVAGFLRRLAPIGWWSLISGERQVGDLIKSSKDGDVADPDSEDGNDQTAQDGEE